MQILQKSNSLVVFLFGLILILILILNLTACKKTSATKPVESAEFEKTIEAIKANKDEINQILRAEEAREAKIKNLRSTWVFLTPAGVKIKIHALAKNNKNIANIYTDENKIATLKQIESEGMKAIYEDKRHKLIVENSVVTLAIDGKMQEMILLSPLVYDFSDGNKEYKITYAQDNKKPVAIILLPDGANIVLPQIEAWAKGAIYGNKNTNWEIQDKTKGILTKDGKKIQLFQSVKK